MATPNNSAMNTTRASGHFSRLLIWNGTSDVRPAQARRENSTLDQGKTPWPKPCSSTLLPGLALVRSAKMQTWGWFVIVLTFSGLGTLIYVLADPRGANLQ